MPPLSPQPVSPLAGPREREANRVRFKVCLVGDPGVGKTALVARYVRDEFTGDYIHTIGTKVSKKEITLVDPQTQAPVVLSLLIWDIMGQPAFRELLRDAYFHGAGAVLGVADLTRPETSEAIGDWIVSVHQVEAGIPVVLALNKSDLAGEDRANAEKAISATQHSRDDVFITSAKTGTGVEEAFRRLGMHLLEPHP